MSTITQKNKYIITVFVCAVCAVIAYLSAPNTVIAVEGEKPVRVRLDATTIQKGFTLESETAAFRLGVTPNAVGEREEVSARIKPVSVDSVSLDGETLVSDLYSFDLYHDDTLEVYKPLWISHAWTADTEKGYVLKNWDSNTNEWVELPSSVTKPEHGWVQAAIHLPYAIIGVFESENPVFEGEGSWYRWHGAAMNDLPIGTEIRVWDPNTDLEAYTTVVSTGPFVEGRIIDLPAEIFEVFAPLSQGVVHVKISPVQ